MTDPSWAAPLVAGILVILGVLAVHGLPMLDRHRQRGTDRWRGAFEGAFDDGIRYGMRRTGPPSPPESPARRQLREWQERLDARHPPETPTPAEMERLLTPFPPMPVPAAQYTPPDSPRGMVGRSAR